MIFRDAVKKLFLGHKIRHRKWPKNKYILFIKGDSNDLLSHFFIHLEDGNIIPYSHDYGSNPDENVWKIY